MVQNAKVQVHTGRTPGHNPSETAGGRGVGAAQQRRLWTGNSIQDVVQSLNDRGKKLVISEVTMKDEEDYKIKANTSEGDRHMGRSVEDAPSKAELPDQGHV